MTAPATVAAPSADDSLRVTVVAVALFVGALVGGGVVGQVATGATVALLLLPAVPLYIMAVWKRPAITIVVALGSALLFEQFTYMIGAHQGPITAHVPIFRSFGGGVVLLPIEVLLLLGLLVWLMKAVLLGEYHMPRSAVTKSLGVFLFLLLIGFGVGLSHGGEFNIALWETRPWLLLAVTYLISTLLVKDRRGLRAVLWTIVVCTGFKGLQCTYMFFSFARSMNPRPESILSHEESVFFGIFMVLTIGLWIYKQRGALRTTATVLLPFVLIADMANSRRTAWPIVIIGVSMLLAITWVTHPKKRRAVGPVLFLMLVISAVYFPLYWNNTGGGTLSQPARAVRSTVSPDPRDESSNLYREQENANLELNIRQSGPLGKGFGTKINYALPIADVSTFDPMIAYIPHNGVLWIWMRLGLQGEIALWVLLGTAVIAASRLARAKDDMVGLFGAMTVCAIVAYIVQGYEDLGFANIRVAVVMGVLLGCVEAASRFSSPKPTVEQPLAETVAR